MDHENIITVDPLHSAVSSSNESDLKELRKAEIAGSLAQSKDDDFEGISNGFLLYKRSVRKSVLRSKAWKKRYFYVTLRTIRCYRDPYDAAPIRALQLQHCKVVVTDNHPKYGNTCFTVVSDMEGGTSYLLRAETAEERTKWVNVLNRYTYIHAFIYTYIHIKFIYTFIYAFIHRIHIHTYIHRIYIVDTSMYTNTYIHIHTYMSATIACLPTIF